MFTLTTFGQNNFVRGESFYEPEDYYDAPCWGPLLDGDPLLYDSCVSSDVKYLSLHLHIDETAFQFYMSVGKSPRTDRTSDSESSSLHIDGPPAALIDPPPIEPPAGGSIPGPVQVVLNDDQVSPIAGVGATGGNRNLP